ncbi:uncharacterized protein LOC114119281 isoform X2 [Aphis gossypii]|uniref:Gustatory receptor n=1 Tax=Aphis gossypii TaxID=80765 RepID=A0A9P0J3I2_APHGO|nr:uncharacterized protein LOC114119281 isoform X2 [Aphis gossypii]CAH1726722.1 unnamed protein product [Aphis gossypii]
MLLRPSLMKNSPVTNKCITLNRTLIMLFIYFILYNIFRTYYMPPKVYDLPSVSFIFFSDPNLLDMIIVTGGCFYIHSVASRFYALNDAWRHLPLGLVEIPGEWTKSEITMSLECLRLLHADLCKIIKVFSLGYGMIMLGYFTFSFVGLLMYTYLYFAVGYKDISDTSFASIIPWCLPLIVRYCQYCIFYMSIVVNASYTNEKKREIISYLRACRISSLAIHTKLQMSEFKSNEISAYGIFNINLHLVISNLILLFYGLITLIQMKDGPFISSLTKAVMKHFTQQYNDIENNTNS